MIERDDEIRSEAAIYAERADGCRTFFERVTASNSAAITTDLRTADGLTIYDLDPQSAELWAVAGPAGVDPATIDPDSLPSGFRWLSDDEWSTLQSAR